jgi:hypothetical protein
VRRVCPVAEKSQKQRYSAVPVGHFPPNQTLVSAEDQLTESPTSVVSRPAFDEAQRLTRGRNSLAEALKFPANYLQADSFLSFVLRRQICLFSVRRE